MIYDVVIVWAWAAGLFAWISLDKKLKKIVLEKNEKPWIKVLLSWWERANVSNMDIDPERDYFTQNKKFLLSIFSKYTNWDIMSFFSENWVSIVEEDRSRLILESWDSKELLACLLKKVKENNCDVKCGDWVEKIEKTPPVLKDIPLHEGELCSYPPHGGGIKGGVFTITTSSWQKYQAKNVIVSSWWKSFSHVWTTGDGYNFAEELWLEIIPPMPCLCGMTTKKDLKDISWVSCKLQMYVKDKKTNKNIYEEVGPILFTHFWVSWPIIHNTSVVSGVYLNSLGISESEFEIYMKDNICLELHFDLENLPKSIIKFFELSEENNIIELDLHSFRSMKEAKATSGWVSTNELDNNMQSKKHDNLYFIGEVVDVTWKTWGFNLQWAWSSWFVAAKDINRK